MYKMQGIQWSVEGMIQSAVMLSFLIPFQVKLSPVSPAVGDYEPRSDEVKGISYCKCRCGCIKENNALDPESPP